MAHIEPCVKRRASQTRDKVGPMCDMCHHLIRRKSKIMDKVIKEIQESQ